MIRIIALIIIQLCCSTMTAFGQTLVDTEGALGSLEMGAFAEDNIIWLGENHGTAATYKLSFDLYKKLDSSIKLNYIIIESGFLTEIYLNEYLQTGDDSLLKKAMNLSPGTAGWTKENKQFYSKIYHHEAEKRPEDRIKFISLDIEHTFRQAHQYIIKNIFSKLPVDTTLTLAFIDTAINTSNDYHPYYFRLFQDIESNQNEYKSLLGNGYNNFYYIVRNIHYASVFYQDINNPNLRDSLIYENFKARNLTFDFSHNKSFAHWGRAHTRQSETEDGTKYIASHIRTHNPEIKQTSFFCLYSKSKFIIPIGYVPRQFRFLYGSKQMFASKRPNDNKKTVRLLKKQSPHKKLSLFKIDQLPDGYAYIPWQKDIDSEEYAQYLFLVVNSPACSPLIE